MFLIIGLLCACCKKRAKLAKPPPQRAVSANWASLPVPKAEPGLKAFYSSTASGYFVRCIDAWVEV